MIFSNSYRKSSVSYQQMKMAQSTNSIQNRPIVQDPPPPSPVKLKWGKPIWTFFHVMAQKMRSEYFHLIIGDFMRIISLICNVLPCPVCSKHAIEYINSVNINNIRTKDDLRQFFYTFHNTVNKRKGYPIFPQESVVSTYENMNTFLVCKEFMYHFEDRNRSLKLLTDDFIRRRTVPQVKTWINSNIQYFEP
jgi:hypothetical protein